MKTTKSISIGSALAVALAALAWGAMSSASAAETKHGGQILNEMQPLRTAADVEALKPGDMIAMACAKCKTIRVTYVDTEAKGGKILASGGKPETVLGKHTCPGCGTAFETVAEGGKVRHNQLRHVCKTCGDESAFCCALKKSDAPTKGMEKKESK
jgi:predicted RNA-binding Zn-ribbon protein involved in translation (DUF1610 family)